MIDDATCLEVFAQLWYSIKHFYFGRCYSLKSECRSLNSIHQMFGLFDNSKTTNAEAGDEEMDATNFFAEFDQFLDDEIDDSPSPQAVQSKSAYDRHTSNFPTITSIDDDHSSVPTTQSDFRASPLSNGSAFSSNAPHHQHSNGSTTTQTVGEPMNRGNNAPTRTVIHFIITITLCDTVPHHCSDIVFQSIPSNHPYHPSQ